MKPLLFAFYLLLGTYAFANSGEKRMHDLPGNRIITYYEQSEERRLPKLNFYEDIWLSYPVITDPLDSTVRKKINQRMYEICMSMIDSNTLWRNISTHHDKTMLSYLKNNPNFRDERGYYRDNDIKFVPLIDNVKLNLVAYCNHILTMELVYEYHSQYGSNKVESDFTYRTMYYVDARNGNEFKSNTIFNPASLPALNKMIESRVIAFFEKYPLEEPEDDDTDDEEQAFYNNLRPNQNKRDKKLISFSADKNAYWSPLVFSFIFKIDEWDPVMDNFYGNPVTLRISFEDIKPYINPKGPFASLLQSKSSLGSVFREQHNYKRVGPGFHLNLNSSVSDVNGYDFYSLHIPDSIKSILVYKINTDARDSVREYKQRELQYSENGNLQECRYFENNRSVNNAVFGFDTSGNLIKIAQLSGAQIKESQDLVYDQKKNLLRVDRFERFRGYSEEHYFYQDSVILSEEITSDNSNARITRQRFKNGLPTEFFNASESEYTRITRYGKQGNILYRNTYGADAVNGQFYTYDNKGRLICLENESNGTRSVYIYDSLGRFAEEVKYDRYSEVYTKKLWYNAEGLPYKIEFVQNSFSSANTLFFRYTYY